MKNGFYTQQGIRTTFPRIIQVTADLWRLDAQLQYVTKSGDKYIIKKGFLTDGASKGELKHFGRYSSPSVLHDALYESELESRSKADDLFLEAMLSVGVSRWRAYLYWSAVRMFGWFTWRKHTQGSIEKGRTYITKVKR